MKRLLVLSCVTFVVFITSSLRADTDHIDLYESNPSYSYRFPINFSWIIEQYDFDQIEEYIDEYYGAYYKHWERYLVSKQKELAGKFGLSNVLIKPNLRRYENTKVVLSKRIWDGKLLFRYLAPVGDMGDFELSIALKPHRFMTFVVKGHMNGEKSVVAVINRSFGSEKGNRNAAQRARRILKKTKQFVKSDLVSSL